MILLAAVALILLGILGLVKVLTLGLVISVLLIVAGVVLAAWERRGTYWHR